MKDFTLVLLVCFLTTGCIKNNVHGIKIGTTLIENETYSENQKLLFLIENVLKSNTKSLSDLINFHCGGAAGCYDLGSVITQVIYKLGEEKFMKMAKNLSQEEKSNLKGLIEVGLEYGFPLKQNDENKRFENQFPIIYKNLNTD